MASFFATPTDFVNSTITIVLAVAIFWFPADMFRTIYKFKDDLRNPEFLEKYGWLFEDLRVTDLSTALFQFFFVIRRLYFAFILVVFP